MRENYYQLSNEQRITTYGMGENHYQLSNEHRIITYRLGENHYEIYNRQRITFRVDKELKNKTLKNPI